MVKSYLKRVQVQHKNGYWWLTIQKRLRNGTQRLKLSDMKLCLKLMVGQSIVRFTSIGCYHDWTDTAEDGSRTQQSVQGNRHHTKREYSGRKIIPSLGCVRIRGEGRMKTARGEVRLLMRCRLHSFPEPPLTGPQCMYL